MKEMFEVGGDIFFVMVIVDVIVVNLWMVVLLLMVVNYKVIDVKMGVDICVIEEFKECVEKYYVEYVCMLILNDYMMIIVIVFGIIGFVYFCVDFLGLFFGVNFFWV